MTMEGESMRHIELDAVSIGKALSGLLPEAAGAGLVALLPEAERDRLPLLQAACRERSIALAGAIFPALIDQESFITHGAWLLPFDRMPSFFLLDGLNDDERPAVERIVAEVRAALAQGGSGKAKPTLFMLFDSMLPNIASMLDGIYLELSNRVDYAGVNAGSESFQPMPCLFDESRVVGNGLLGLLLPGELAPVLEHGFVQPEQAMSATSTEGNRIAMIDWQPAFDVYRQVIRDAYGIDLTRDNFYQHAVHFPFGILRANGDVVVRIPVALAEDGSLFCVGEVPENAVLVLLKAPGRSANGCIQRLSDNLRSVGGSLRDGQLLTFYCAGRRMHLGADAEGELAELRAATGAAQVAGALSLGEVGSTSRWGYPMFHNATLVCTVWQGP